MKDFTVTLISNGSEQYFSDNTLINFANQLPNEISLSRKKMVRLTSKLRY